MVLALWLPLSLTVDEVLGVREGLAPVLSVPVGEELALELRVAVLERVGGGVAVADPVPVAVPVALAVPLALALAESLMLLLPEALAPLLRLAVGLTERELPRLLLLLGVLLGELLPV